MQRAATFLAGMIVGSGLLATAGGLSWTHGANDMISTHSGVKFTEVKSSPCVAPEPCVDHLRIHIQPALYRPEVVSVAQRHAGDPDFKAILEQSPESRASSVVLQILHPDSITLLGPDGKPAGLCSTKVQ